MSFANYLNANKIPNFDSLLINEEPKNTNDSARITDTISYLGNATYPKGTQTLVNDASFTPLFFESNRVEFFNNFENEYNSLGVPIEQFNFPSGVVNLVSGSNYTINNPDLNSATPNPVLKTTYELQFEVGGNANTEYDVNSNIKIPTQLFYSLEEAEKVEYIKINGKLLNVEFLTENNNKYVFSHITTQTINDHFDDALIITSPRDNIQFNQLADIQYEVYVLNYSCKKFQYRLAIYDESFNRLEAYPALTYDPSVNTLDPSGITALSLNGSSVDFPTNAVYAFMEVACLEVGVVNFEYKYAYSNLQTALANKDAFNIFEVDYTGVAQGGGGGDLSQLEAEVAQLQQLTTAQQGEINSLETNKLDISGGTLTGTLDMSGQLLITESILAREQINFGNGGTNGRITNDINRFYIQSGNNTTEQKIYFTKNLSTEPVVILDCSNEELDLTRVITKLPNYTNVNNTLNQMNSQIQTNIEDITSNTQSLNNKVNKSGDTMSGLLNMGNNKISNLKAGTANGDAVNVAQLNQATGGGTGFLPLSGGTLTGQLTTQGGISVELGNVNLNSSQYIVNSPDPISSHNVANKNYVDNQINNIDFTPYLNKDTTDLQEVNATITTPRINATDTLGIFGNMAFDNNSTAFGSGQKPAGQGLVNIQIDGLETDSIVLITPTTTPGGYFWVVPNINYFTLYCEPSATNVGWNFNYVWFKNQSSN